MPQTASPSPKKTLRLRAEKILAQLAQPGAYIKTLVLPSSQDSRPASTSASRDRIERRKPQFGLFKSDPNSTTPIAQFGPDILKYLLAQDWVRKTGARFTMTQAGRAALKRRATKHDKFRRQHQIHKTQNRKVDGNVSRPVTVNETESPLGWLRKRKDRNGNPLISEVQFQAGERLRADFWRAQMTPRVTMSWSAMTASSKRVKRAAPGASTEISDAVIAAKARVARALDAVGPELSGILIDVCCHMTGLEQFEQQAGWPQRSGKLALKLALNALARHYGLIATPRVEWSGGQIRHWGTADYCPNIDG